MNDKTFNILKISTAFALAFMFIFTAVYTYWGNFQKACELTFLSNLLSGLFLLIASILWLCNKHVYEFLFLDFSVLLLTVFLICMAFFKDFNLEGGFKGGFAFLHIVNPLLLFVYHLFFSDQSKVKFQFILSTLIMPIVYLTFALIFGAITGNFVYPNLDYTNYGAGNTIIFIFVVIIGLIVISIGLYLLNKLIHKHLLKNI